MFGKQKTKRKEELSIDPYFVSKVQPIGGIEFKDKYIKKADGYEACIFIHQYPTQANKFWMLKLMGKRENVIVTYDIATGSRHRLFKKLNNALIEQENRAQTDKSKVGQIRARNEYNKLTNLTESIENNGEVLKEVYARIYVSARTKEELDKDISDILKELEEKNFRGIVNLNEQSYDWQALSCGLSEQKKFINRRSPKIIPSTSLGGGFPFYFTSLDDPTGLFLGRTFTGGNVNFDIFTKTNERSYYNAVVIGGMGSGKSTLLKKLAEHNTIVSNKVRIIDVTGEYRSLVQKFGGKVISLDGTGEGKINLLEVFATVVDDQTYQVKDEESFMIHKSKLSQIYKTLTENMATIEEVREFETLLDNFYTEFGIEKHKATRYNTREYPIMSEFLKYIKETFYEDIENKKINQNLSENSQLRIEKVLLNIESLVRDYGLLFDGYSTINDIDDENIISFELRNLTGMDKRIFNTQMFNVFTLNWNSALINGMQEKSKYDRGIKSFEDVTKYLLISDESHRTINANNIPLVEYQTNCAREFRKYFGGIIFATQSIRDVAPADLNSESFEKIKTLFELTQYKFMMKQDPNSMSILSKVFEGQLSESELQVIPRLSMGQTILSITGLDNIKFGVYASKAELDLFKGGA